jgi:hypothetical protein
MVFMAYESWSQVVIRTVLETKTLLKYSIGNYTIKNKIYTQNCLVTILNGCNEFAIYTYFFYAAIEY